MKAYSESLSSCSRLKLHTLKLLNHWSAFLGQRRDTFIAIFFSLFCVCLPFPPLVSELCELKQSNAFVQIVCVLTAKTLEMVKLLFFVVIQLTVSKKMAAAQYVIFIFTVFD